MLFLLLSIALAATPQHLDVSPTRKALTGTAYAVVDNANLRSAPSRQGESVARLPLATAVTVLSAEQLEKIGSREDHWYKVRAKTAQGELEGYVFGTTLTTQRLLHDVDADGTEEVIVAAWNGAGELVIRMRDAADVTAPVAWGKWGEGVDAGRVRVELIPAVTAGVPLFFFRLPWLEPDECFDRSQASHFVVVTQSEDGGQLLSTALSTTANGDCTGESGHVDGFNFDRAKKHLYLTRVNISEEDKTYETRSGTTYVFDESQYKRVGETIALGQSVGGRGGPSSTTAMWSGGWASCLAAPSEASDELMADALEMMNADPTRKDALTAARLTAKRVDLNDDGVDDWFIVSWADCGATATPLDATACKGTGYLARPRCDGDYCYVGTARQTDFPGPFLACRSSFVDLNP